MGCATERSEVVVNYFTQAARIRDVHVPFLGYMRLRIIHLGWVNYIHAPDLDWEHNTGGKTQKLHIFWTRGSENMGQRPQNMMYTWERECDVHASSATISA